MGNCLHRAELSPSTENSSQLDFEDVWNSSYGVNDSFPDGDYGANLEAAAPCHSCNLLDDSALPFFILTSVLGSGPAAEPGRSPGNFALCGYAPAPRPILPPGHPHPLALSAPP
uniref:Atypical chemokine receptor 1 n=1 Tax=Homo sapiens TaxID=9606 RepID=A0AAQ5BHJ4_HUMAN